VSDRPANVHAGAEAWTRWPWVSADVIAEHLGITKNSVDTWFAKEDAGAHRVGRPWKFKVTEVDERVRGKDVSETVKPSEKRRR
jgi:hypothetical protein